MTIEDQAREFATHYHGSIGQTSRYTSEPYIMHPSAVVEIVRQVPHNEFMFCAAWLHDVVEDTPATLRDVERAFGLEVASLVEMLTDVSTPSDGNRTARKAIDREHIGKATPDAKTIKLADLIDNTGTIVEYDPGFARIYLAEKARLLEVMREGDTSLWLRAHAMLELRSGE